MLRDKHLMVIGAGNIGRILLERLHAAGVPADHLTVYDSDPDRGQTAAAQFGVRVVSLTDEMACSADAVLIATPPPTIPQVVQALKWLRPGQVIVSFAAAVPLERLEALTPPGVSVARVMPNAPSLVGRGMNPVAFGTSVTPEARALVETLLAALGETIVVHDEQMNWCVGLTGAAMRSVLPVLEGMTQAGVEAGLEVESAQQVAAQVMLGTAALVLQTGLAFAEIKALTPLVTVDEAWVSQLFHDAARAAKDKVERTQHKLWEDS